MRILPIFVLSLLLSCSAPLKTISKVSDSKNSALARLWSAATSTSDSNPYATPAKIPHERLPEADVYYIRTRVVVEGLPVRINHAGEMVEGWWWARQPEEVMRDLKHAEEIFAGVGVKFQIVEYKYEEYNVDIRDNFAEAKAHPGVMTINYMLPKIAGFDGLSTGPWEWNNIGIMITDLADEWVLAHEIGHYFGLLHTFDEDYLDDTALQGFLFCTGKPERIPNCHNIMSYCDHFPYEATRGQVERFRRFLRAKRMDHVTRERKGIYSNGKLPLPPASLN